MSFQWQLDSFFSLREDGLADDQTEREHRDVQVKVALSGKNLNNTLSSNGYLIPFTGVWYLVLCTWYYMNCTWYLVPLAIATLVQIRHGDFRLRISQDEEDIQSVLDWYNRSCSRLEYNYMSTWILNVSRVDAVFLDHLSQDIRGTNSSAVWRWSK